MNSLSIKEIYKSYNEKPVLKGITFEVLEGEILAVLGPSGCGKSTLLAIIAGIEPPDSGDIFWKGESIINEPPNQRGFGLMFQDLSLFPHMNVSDNVAFGLRMAGFTKQDINHHVSEALTLVGLSGYEVRDVNTLSGGEQQRVALARSLAPNPRLLMLDEPLGSLDRQLRERLILDLRRILHRIQQTAIYVTHDQEEAFALADHVVIMNEGGIEQIGTPHDIYCKPKTPYVARFLDMTNLLPGMVQKNEKGRIVSTLIGDFPTKVEVDGSVILLIRPDGANFTGTGSIKFPVTIIEQSFRGSTTRLFVKIKDTQLAFDFPSHSDLPNNGETVDLFIDPQQAIHIYDQKGT
jgi:ABC-type Fe3+/spermidine/putrescine transport system ATPase subunit